MLYQKSDLLSFKAFCLTFLSFLSFCNLSYVMEPKTHDLFHVLPQQFYESYTISSHVLHMIQNICLVFRGRGDIISRCFLLGLVYPSSIFLWHLFLPQYFTLMHVMFLHCTILTSISLLAV